MVRTKVPRNPLRWVGRIELWYQILHQLIAGLFRLPLFTPFMRDWFGMISMVKKNSRKGENSSSTLPFA
jgi:hypothetical protein